MRMYFGMAERESQVLKVLIGSPKDLFGYKISELSGINKATVYLALKSLERSGFVTCRTETRKEKAGRAGLSRHYYKPTIIGVRMDKLKQDAQAFVKAAK